MEPEGGTGGSTGAFLWFLGGWLLRTLIHHVPLMVTVATDERYMGAITLHYGFVADEADPVTPRARDRTGHGKRPSYEAMTA